MSFLSLSIICCPFPKIIEKNRCCWDLHFDKLIAKAISRLYILRVCKFYGYSQDQLKELFHSLILSIFVYGIEVWGSANLVPRSHSVTGNVRSGQVRQYTIFHWLLKKGCGNAIYNPNGLFRGALNQGLVFASSCAVLNKCQLCGGKFCFFRRRKSFTVKETHFKNLRRLC